MKRRALDVHDYSAGKYFSRLEELLGSDEIESRLARIEHEIRVESGIYLREWVVPKRAWWLGFRDARAIFHAGGSFRRAITPIMERPLQTAVKLSILHSNMPERKRREFASRILGDDILTPTLFEIDCAAHFHALGYDIEWFEVAENGVRSPEFIAKQDGVQIEVECKAKMADSGRRVERAAFYRTVDELIPVISQKALCGAILLTFPRRFPTRPAWRSEAARALEQQLAGGRTTISLSSGERFECDLRPMDGSEVSAQAIADQMAANANPYAHFAISGTPSRNAIRDPLIFRLESEKKDAFLQNVLDSLRTAEAQFTGTRAAIINCMIPEVDSFEGLQADSAIQKMTYFFFDRYARPFVNAVSYVGEMKREAQGMVILSDMPSLTFRNHKYDTAFGPEMPVYG